MRKSQGEQEPHLCEKKNNQRKSMRKTDKSYIKEGEFRDGERENKQLQEKAKAGKRCKDSAQGSGEL